ncbi:hypothetical protein QO010_000701 [Caulobacter ginsengisoli]|uniref:Uncharacterized protein n=1 Tax=Caulobacter ginsengisoli TaxID=400775 RepID=A0ABU0ILQ8_9CAUL|nr:hypothetical protein [Caulobacter ginsengisoli]MDQ0462953.1 hypothetical protein [Caulobacter ginsengisoli]
MRAIIAIATLLAGVAFAIQQRDNPALLIPILMFAAGVALIIAMTARKALAAPKPSAAKGGNFVTVCLGVPSGSPTPVQTFAVLPAYCRNLLRTGS